jgi:hypothetical protein
MATPISFGLQNNDGSPKSDAAPVFLKYITAGALAAAAPANPVHRVGGDYVFQPSDADELARRAWLVDCGAGANPRYVFGTVPKDCPDLQVQLLTDGAGAPWAGAPPTLSGYRTPAGGAAPSGTLPIIFASGALAVFTVPAADLASPGVIFRWDSPDPAAFPTFAWGAAEGVAELALPPPLFTLSLSVTPGVAAGQSALRDMALDPATGDLLQVENDQVWLTGAEAIASDLRSRLQTFLGEWFADATIGFAWFERVLGQKPRDGQLAELFGDLVRGTPGIVDMPRFVVTKTGPRSRRISLDAQSDFGDLISATLSTTEKGS